MSRNEAHQILGFDNSSDRLLLRHVVQDFFVHATHRIDVGQAEAMTLESHRTTSLASARENPLAISQEPSRAAQGRRRTAG
jgi:hypothetical protein